MDKEVEMKNVEKFIKEIIDAIGELSAWSTMPTWSIQYWLCHEMCISYEAWEKKLI